MLSLAMAEYLRPLLQHAVGALSAALGDGAGRGAGGVGVSGSAGPATLPVIFHATAGLRLVAPEARDAILGAVARALETSPDLAALGFTLDVRAEVISGAEEARLSWVAANKVTAVPTLLGAQYDGGIGGGDKVDEVAVEKPVYGLLELGGASTQIAYATAAASAPVDGSADGGNFVFASHLG